MEISSTQVLPVLDLVALQKAATDAAMKGALKSIEDFYTSYNSPFRKIIDAELAKTELHGNISLPDILGIINDSLTAEIDAIANTAIAQTFVPLVKRFLVRADKEMKFSEILSELVEIDRKKWDENEHVSFDDCDVEIKESEHGWLDISVTIGETYRFTLHSDYDTRNAPVKKYVMLSLPRKAYDDEKNMVLSIDGAELKIPFASSVLRDEFALFSARIVLARTLITMDCRGFSEDMFPSDHCHC